ncbi:MAG: hypothetical protein GC185_10215 [Alphaproteobacteria bacterium]|nr:hypothetical protein [Alphaproteobacteria bacterium]
MAGYETGNVHGQWDKTALPGFWENLAPARAKEDREKLSAIFNYAAQLPMGREALEWAQDNEIDFIVDHTTKANGYYWGGSGVVALSSRILMPGNEVEAAGTLVHEIRHAWQDARGMLPTRQKDFATDFIGVSLIEADAETFGNVTRYQGYLHKSRGYLAGLSGEERDGYRGRSLEKAVKSYESWLSDEQKALWRGFKEWYGSWRAPTYGTTAARSSAVRLGIPGVTKRDFLFEYNPYPGGREPATAGFEFTRQEQLRRLGKGFSGKRCMNYFNEAAREELDQMRSPARARVFYRPSGTTTPLMREIRLRELKLAYAKRQKAKTLKVA